MIQSQQKMNTDEDEGINESTTILKIFLIWAILMCLYKLLKIKISQNTSIYCQCVSWQLVSDIRSHLQANTELY
jgi:hypothetical protein